ncbi:MAG: type IV pilin protein [Rubrivivax sp.]|nr:type IV pilin protein [Rubrivivax sp.]
MRRDPAARRRRPAGVSLVEVCVALAVIGVLAATAWPSHLGSLYRARRADAVAALSRLHMAQEQHRARTGEYVGTMSGLGSAGRVRSDEGHYLLSVEPAEPGSVVLVATARGDGPQAGDTACPTLTLHLRQGFADAGPDGRCWNR